MEKSELVRLVANTCHVINGMWYGTFPDQDIYDFANEDGSVKVQINLEESTMLAKDSVTTIQMFALETVARDAGLNFDIYFDNDDDENNPFLKLSKS